MNTQRTGWGTGKQNGEGNVHVANWKRDAAKKTDDELVALFNSLPAHTAWSKVLRREMAARGIEE